MIKSFLPLGVRSKGRLRFDKVLPSFMYEVKGETEVDEVVLTFRCKVEGEAEV